ncbi:hypothetical protein Tco_1118382, partial [Tanacetum coccineum]
IHSDESKVHVEVLSVLWENRLSIPDGSLPLSRCGRSEDQAWQARDPSQSLARVKMRLEGHVAIG